jgi:hypothetical protein
VILLLFVKITYWKSSGSRQTHDPRRGLGDEKGKQYHNKSSPETTISSFSGSLPSHPQHISISVNHCHHLTLTLRRCHPQSTTSPPVGHRLRLMHLAASHHPELLFPYTLRPSSSAPSCQARRAVHHRSPLRLKTYLRRRHIRQACRHKSFQAPEQSLAISLVVLHVGQARPPTSVPPWVTRARMGCRPVDALRRRWLGLGSVGAGPVVWF